MDKDFGKSYTRFIEGVELKRIELEKMELQRYRPKQINNIEVNVDLNSVSTLVAELYECKTILDTFLYYSDQKDPPIKRKNYNKLAFMNYNGSHFSLNNNVAVCIITLQKNSFRAKNILEELKFLFIKIVDGEELHKVLKKKLSINRLKVIKSV